MTDPLWHGVGYHDCKPGLVTAWGNLWGHFRSCCCSTFWQPPTNHNTCSCNGWQCKTPPFSCSYQLFVRLYHHNIAVATRSSDIDPMENVCDILGHRMKKMDPSVQPLAQLEVLLHQEWQQIIPSEGFFSGWGMFLQSFVLMVLICIIDPLRHLFCCDFIGCHYWLVLSPASQSVLPAAPFQSNYVFLVLNSVITDLLILCFQ